MSRFNYLVDAPPRALDRLRRFSVSQALRFPLGALATSCLVVLAWWGLERYWLASSRHEVAVATARLADSELAFRQAKLVRANVDDLLAFDERLRTIRRSGAVLSERLASIANHVPQRAWLTAIAHTSDGVELDGRADGLLALSNAVASLMTDTKATRLVRATRDEKKGSGVVSFTVVLPESR